MRGLFGVISVHFWCMAVDLEYHLFLLWERGAHCRGRILNDLRRYFDVVYVRDLCWPEAQFEANLLEFYNNRDIRRYLEGKISRVGTGSFTVAVVRDAHPEHGERETTHGRDVVNTRIFDKKMEYRGWIGHNALHASDTAQEAVESLRLLFAKLPPAERADEDELLRIVEKSIP